MAITTARGTLVKVSDVASPPVYSNVGQVRSISGPTAKPNIVDVTTHDTPGFWRRKIAVLNDAGEVSFEVNFDVADATHAFSTGLWNRMVNLTLSLFQVKFPNSAGTLNTKGYVGSHEFNAPVDNVLGAKIMLALTDAITTSVP